MELKVRRRGTLFLVLLVALGLIAAACGDDDDTDTGAAVAEPAAEQTEESDGTTSFDELVAAATEEGKVTIYSSQGLDQLNALAESFEAEYPGIDVEVVRGIDADLSPKVEAEFQTGRGIADFFVNASLSWVQPQADQGRFVAPVGPQLTGHGNYDAAQYVHEGNYFEVSAAVLSFGWNTDLHPDGLTDYEDLLDPELGGGKIGVIEPTSPSIVDFYLWLEENFGEAYVEALAAQEPRIYPSSLPMGEAMTSGEIAAGSFIAPGVLEPSIQQGAPIQYGISAKGAWGARFYGMILETAPHPNAAQLLADYMVTATGQELIAPVSGSVLPDVPGTLLTVDKVRLQDPAALTPEKVEAYQQKWNSLFR